MAAELRLYPAGFVRFFWPILVFQLFLFACLWSLAGPLLFDSPEVMEKWQYWALGIHIAPIVIARFFSGKIHFNRRARPVTMSNLYEIGAWLALILGSYYITWHFAGPEASGVQERLAGLPQDSEGRRTDALIYLGLLIIPTVGWAALIWGQMRQIGRPLRFSLPKPLRWLRVFGTIMVVWLAGIPLYSQEYQTSLKESAGWPVFSARAIVDADAEHAKLVPGPRRIIHMAGRHYVFITGSEMTGVWDGQSDQLAAVAMTVPFEALGISGIDSQMSVTITEAGGETDSLTLPDGVHRVEASHCMTEGLPDGEMLCSFIDRPSAQPDGEAVTVPYTAELQARWRRANADPTIQPSSLMQYLVRVEDNSVLSICSVDTCTGDVVIGDLLAAISYVRSEAAVMAGGNLMRGLQGFVEGAEIKDRQTIDYLVFEQGQQWSTTREAEPMSDEVLRQAALLPPAPTAEEPAEKPETGE